MERLCLKMREHNAGDTPRARTSSDLDSPAATQFDKEGNVSIVINSGVKQRSKKWSQRSWKDTDVVGMAIRRNFIYGGGNGGAMGKHPGGFRTWQGFIIFIILICSQFRGGYSILFPHSGVRYESYKIPN